MGSEDIIGRIHVQLSQRAVKFVTGGDDDDEDREPQQVSLTFPLPNLTFPLPNLTFPLPNLTLPAHEGCGVRSEG